MSCWLDAFPFLWDRHGMQCLWLLRYCITSFLYFLSCTPSGMTITASFGVRYDIVCAYRVPLMVTVVLFLACLIVRAIGLVGRYLGDGMPILSEPSAGTTPSSVFDHHW